MFLDLHIHSRYSFDCWLDPARIVEVAKKKGLDGIAVVDHNTIQGALEAADYLVDNFIVIVGAEINTEVGDVVGLFLSKDINSRRFEEVVNEIHSQGGIAILAHPNKRKKIIDTNIFGQLDAIEGFNSRNPEHNVEAKNISAQYDLPAVAGSDAHFAFEIGKAKTILECGSDMESIKQAILGGKTKITGEISPGYVDILSQAIRFCRMYE